MKKESRTALNKKGAIEMSMTTIIIIIIGVVLLSLGLAFVQQIFSKAKGLATETFQKAEGQIKDFEQIKTPLTITPERIELGKGDSTVVSVILANFGEKKVSAKAIVSTKFTDDISCVFVDAESTTSDPYTLNSGEFKSLDLRVKSEEGEKSSLGDKSCKVVASGLGESVQDTISIKVVA